MNATHPSKEQVRAYLAQRGLAHLPPPSPEEIRRRLDWRCAPPSEAATVAMLPATLFQLGAAVALSWVCWPLALAKNTKK